MLANDKLTKESILSAHHDAADSRSGGNPVLLAVQDTMSVNYGTHTKTKGMGYNCEQSLGLNVHSCLLMQPDGIPLGLLSQSTVTRAENNSRGKSRAEKRARPIEEKESFRWLETMQTAAQNAPKQAKLIHIADREGDIYELYALAMQTNEKFIIRAAHDRIDTENTHIMQAIRDNYPVGETVVTVSASRKTGARERDVELTIQYQIFEVKKPQIRQKDAGLEPTLCLTLIRLAEKNPAKGIQPTEWLLMTNLEINSVNDVLLVAEYYKQRWKIERFHFVLKSGCKIENIQQRSVDGIELMIMMYSIIAIHIMQLTFLSRNAPETPCDIIFDETEWKTLYRAANRSRSEPEKPPSMEEAMSLVAKLGGHVGAKSDGPPGLKVIWIGLNKLFLLVAYLGYL
jgi:predicted nucleotidyltransferase